MSGGDHSLNARMKDDSNAEWIDQLPSAEADQESLLLEHQESGQRRDLLAAAMERLNEREQDIIRKRRLSEPVVTLEELSQEYGVSRERIRQIEMRAFEKLQQYMNEAESSS